jgi:hypothetical protein
MAGLGMTIIVMEGKKESSLDNRWKKHIDSMTHYMSKHPGLYGLKSWDKSGTGEKFFKNGFQRA